MKSWSNNLKIGGGIAAVAVLAGIGVLVWALGFRGESKSAQPTPAGGYHPIAASDSFNFSIPSGPNAVNPEFTTNGVSQLNTAPLVDAASVLAAGDAMIPAASTEKLDYSLRTSNTAGAFTDGGVKQLPTAPLQSTDTVLAAGDLMTPQATVQTFDFPLSTKNAVTGEGGTSFFKTATLDTSGTIVSAGDALFAGANLDTTIPLKLTTAGPNAISPSALSENPTVPSTSVGVTGDLLFADASLTPGQSFSYPLAGTNAVAGLNGTSQFKTAPMVSASTVASAGELMFAQATLAPSGTFTPAGAQKAPSTTVPNIHVPAGASSLGARSAARHLSSASAGGFGIVFCGNVTGGHCSPAYRTSMPHTAPQLLVGFVWQGLAVGTKVNLIFVDVNARKIIGRPTTTYSLPAAQGGTILAKFKGPAPIIKFGVGIILNGHLQKGIYVLNIV